MEDHVRKINHDYSFNLGQEEIQMIARRDAGCECYFAVKMKLI